MQRRFYPAQPRPFLIPQPPTEFRFSQVVRPRYAVYSNHPQQTYYVNNFVNPSHSTYDVHDHGYRESIRQDILNQLKGGYCQSPSVMSNNRKRHSGDNKDNSKGKKIKLDKVDLMRSEDVPVPPQGYNPVHNITQAIIKYFIENHQTEKAYKKKLQLRDALFTIMQGVLPNCGLYIVGSSMSGFGTMKSDMDMCLMITDTDINQKLEAPEILVLIQRALIRCSFVRQSMVIRAKVPILRFVDAISRIEVDLNVNNSVGIRNTHLLKYYCMADWRVRPLVLYIKKWARFHDINDASKATISSYSLCLMLIHYLQCGCSPPVLPSLQELYPVRFNPTCDIRELRFDEKVEYKSDNTQSVGELFLGFLSYYSHDSKFDFAKDCISVRRGTKFNLKDFLLTRTDTFSWKTLCIEEPFDLSNTARSCHKEEIFLRVQRVFRRSHRKLQQTKDVRDIFSEPF